MIFKENADQRGAAPQLPTAIEPRDPQAAADLLPLVYQELRRLAAYKMAHEAPGQTLQPTPLPMKSRPCGASPDQAPLVLPAFIEALREMGARARSAIPD